MPEIVGDNVDRICTVEMRPGKGNLPRGTIRAMYDVARKREGRPLTFAMADSLLKSVPEHGTVIIVTGAGGPPYLPCGEVDGLLGAASIARALHFGRNAEIHMLVEPHISQPLGEAVRGAGLNVAYPGDVAMEHSTFIHETPIAHDDCNSWSVDLLEQLDPAAVIAIEKLGPNSEGVIHGATGLSYDDVHFKPQYLFREAAERGILTCGIGDGGNEVGFGVVHEEVSDIMPAGRRCECGCGGGSVTVTPTDVLCVAAISDWGGYGVAAMIGHLLERPGLLIGADDLERMLRAAVDHGAYDGALARPVLSDDGVPLRAHRAMINMLGEMLTIAASEVSSPGH